MATVQEEMRQHSQNYIAELDLRKSKLEHRVIDFFTSETMKCLVLETRDTRIGALRIRRIIKQLNHSLYAKYEQPESKIFLKWEQLLNTIGPAKVLPKFGSLLVLEFSDNQPEYRDVYVLEALLERINMVPAKKAVLIFGHQFWPDTYLKGINVDSFLKINEFDNTVTSLVDTDHIKFLYKSAVAGRTNHVCALIEQGTKLNEPGDDKGNTVLHGAAESGDKELVLKLLQSGALVIANKLGDTPLHVAAEYGHVEVAVTLLEYVGDKDFKDNNAVVVNSENKSGRTPLHLAADLGHYLVAKTLLNYGANANSVDTNGCSPLHFAAGFQDSNIVKLLIERGASTDAKNKWGETALDIARHNGYDHVEGILSMKDRGSRLSVNLRMI